MPNSSRSPMPPSRAGAPAPPIERGQPLPEPLTHYLGQYAKANPSAAALWCFAIGFIVGWRLKPW